MRVARPIFSVEADRVVQPTEGWTVYHEVRRFAHRGFRVARPLEPGWDDDDPLICEWFKIGDLLQDELAELEAI